MHSTSKVAKYKNPALAQMIIIIYFLMGMIANKIIFVLAD